MLCQVKEQHNVIKTFSFERADNAQKLAAMKIALVAKENIFKESSYTMQILEKQIEKLKKRQSHLEMERELLLKQIRLWIPKLNRFLKIDLDLITLTNQNQKQ